MSKFGLIQPTLIQQIKKILDQYPDDGQILKELIQNAEDAGAKKIKFLFDHQSYKADKLSHFGLDKFQGPALYAYNDAKFTEADWEGLGMLCDSIKEKDPTKVGRFGLGFKSVFHMTDLPSVISGDSLGIIDPHEKYFSDTNGKRSGRRWSLKSKNDRKYIQQFSDQFAPYRGIFDCTDESFRQGCYDGTLFRLPLRQKASKLSSTLYSMGKMQCLFECFKKDAHLILLFLKNLEKIEVYERDSRYSEPRKLFLVGISKDCLQDVRKARKEFEARVQKNILSLSDGTFSEVKKTYPLTIETVLYHDGESHGESRYRFVVTLFFSGSDVSQEIKELMIDESLSYLPLLGVALPLKPQLKRGERKKRRRKERKKKKKRRKHEGIHTNINRDDDSEDDNSSADDDQFQYEDMENSENCNKRDSNRFLENEPQGHLFCFLPLPLENKSLTGLPVHVNGFFALSQNRRHLKWPSADQDEANLTDKSLLWNKGLLQEVLPKAYAELILYVTSCLSREESHELMTTRDVYGAWPDITKVDVKWKDILQPFFELLLGSKVLHSDANGGVWCKVEDVILDNLEKSDQSRKVVIDVLNKTGKMVVTAPVHVKTAVEHYRTVKYITPKILRNSLKENPSCYSDNEDKILLLKFVLKDSDFKDLEGLELLPLSDKTFTTFQRKCFSVPIYIDSAEHPKSLLPRLQRMFLDTKMDNMITKQLKSAVKKGHTQLCYFDKEAVKRHLREALTSDWLGPEDRVTWYPGRSDQPTREWMKELWLYFGKHFRNVSDLDGFIGLPLVPVSSVRKRNEVQLAKIQRSSCLVLASFNGENIDDAMCKILKTLGLTILNDLPEYLLDYSELVPNIANPASPKGVLNAMGVFITKSRNEETILQILRSLHPDDIRLFRAFLSRITSVNMKEKELLQKLPLFETWVGCGRKSSKFVSLNKVNKGAPVHDDLPAVKVSIDLLDLQKPSSRNLAHLLDTVPMTNTDLLKVMLDDALENMYSDKELDELVKYTFKRFGIFDEKNAACFKENLRRLPFVKSCDNSRRKPGELFDPEVKIIRKIFLEEDVFPQENYYARPDVLMHLRKLGLKGKDSINADDILRCARLVNKIGSTEKAKIKSKAILKLLEQAPSLLQEKVKPGKCSLSSCLNSIVWIPVFTHRPTTYPTGLFLKKSKNGCFACPKDVTSHEFINLVGSVKLMVNSQSFPTVSKIFGWNKHPCLQDVGRHLENVIEAFQNTKSLDEIKTMKFAFEKIYYYFQNSLKDERDEVKELLSPINFILVQKKLLSANRVAFSSQLDYPPYLCKLSRKYQDNFHELLKTVGVRESFELHDYIKTLEEVKRKYGNNSITKERVQVANVLNLLAEAMKKEGVTAAEVIGKYESEIIFIPDSNGIMKPSNELCVKDCYWMPDEPGVGYVNKDIPPHICITLGANTRRQETLRKHTIGIPFGQKEKLTNRLKRILTGYPCDESIMKELLQNADDAKASKLCFIKDPRQHRDERVFEKTWKPLQGPALCVYNNAPFTKSDIEGIQNLGEGNKGDDPNKTGQYGVGFNAVYHLTDAPTFISQGDEIGEVMCVFDPLLKFAPGADTSNPGVMYKDLPRLRQTFTDVFPCYYLDQHLPLNNATMFRFPLRNEDMASSSTISNKAMTIEELDKLLNDFEEELLEILLFVNNVKKISICEINKKTGKLKETYHVQASLSSEEEKKRTEFAAHVNKIGKSVQSGKRSITDIPVSKVSYVLDLKDSRGLNQKWFVVQRIGFENKEEIPLNVDEAFKKGDLGLLPRGGVASLISSSKNNESPAGKAFCFLPLPFKTGLPVHINGHFALDHEARRSLWRDDKGDYRSNWNDTLLRKVVAPCYVSLLDEVRRYISLPRRDDEKTYIHESRDMVEDVVLNYVDRFPSSNDLEMYWEALCKEVYYYMNAKGFPLLPILRQENQRKKSSKKMITIEWLPPTGKGCNQAFFDNLVEVFQDDTEELHGKRKTTALEKENLIRDTLLDVGFNLLFMPLNVYSGFKLSGVNVSLISPKDVINFFLTYNSTGTEKLCDIGSLPLRIKYTKFKSISGLLAVLKYCKQDKGFLSRLEGLPLLLTEDNNLQVFTQSHKVFLSRYYEVLPSCSSMFVHHECLNSVFHVDDEAKCSLSPVFKVFDIAAFARFLPKEMKESHYKSTNRYVKWHLEIKDNRIPNSKWIWDIWRFFSNHIEKIINKYLDDQRRKRLSYSDPPYDQRKLEKQNQKRLTKEALDPVKDWCLLPAFEAIQQNRSTDDVKHNLVPLRLADTVIYLEGSASETLKTVLRKVPISELNCWLPNGECEKPFYETARRIVADLDDPKSVLSAFTQKLNIDSHAFKRLRENDCITLLGYFNDKLSQLDLTSAEHLKNLPLYPSIHGDIISINGKRAFVLSTRIPKDDMHVWEETSGIVFLKENDILRMLYEFLDCHSKDEVDVYCDVIFENFEDMKEKARLKHMKFARELMRELESSLDYSSDKVIIENKAAKLKKLSETLSKLKFIQAKDGTLMTASSFYDPSNKVFKVMFENKQEMFPSAPFCDSEWPLFLRKIGLIHQVSNEQFLQFAKEVEAEAKTRQDNETRRKSKILVACLFEFEDVASSNLLDEVKGICFIFPYTVKPRLQSLYEQYGSRETGLPCICFQGSVVSRNSSVTWTSANLLPDYANPFRCKDVELKSEDRAEKISRKLHILQNPTVDMVVTHCKNICNSLSQISYSENDEESNGITGLIGIMIIIYKYLQKNYDGNEAVINQLQKIRCIVVDDGRRFVYPNQVAVDITSNQEIQPYLYKIPQDIAAYGRLFEKLGTSKTVTFSQYAMVLENLYRKSGNESLDPNETSKAFKATKGIFEVIVKENFSQDSEISQLFLPGMKLDPKNFGKKLVFLRKSADIFYNDAPHFKERIKKFNNLVLVKLSECHLNVTNDEVLVKKLHERFRPCMLTTCVHETLLKDSQPDFDSTSKAQELRHILTSSEFCHGVIRLIRHANYKSDVETSIDIPNIIQERLKCIRVYSVPDLRTRLVFNGKAIPDSEADVFCFEEKAKDGEHEICNVYIKKEAELNRYTSVVAEVVDRITGHLLKTMLVHLPTMLSSKPCEIKDLLDGLKIREDGSFLETEATCLPTPGNFIHIADHHLLVDDFTVFSPGEYVGYELDDPSFRGEDGTPTYIYAIIIEEVTNKGRSSTHTGNLSTKRYRIDIGKENEPIVVDAADLYKFYRPNRTSNETLYLQLEIYSGHQTRNENQDIKPDNLDEARREVTRILEDAWRLPEEKQKKIIKRLYLKWHPDKNPGNEKFCTEVFKFIQKEIKRLEDGPNIKAQQSKSAGNKYHEHSFSSFFKTWGKRATSHKKERNSFKFNDEGFSFSQRKNPQPAEAKRWFKQATADLNAATNEHEHKPSYEWVCFKCHQSSEKALKAAQYSIDADKTSTHSLTMIAQYLGNSTLQTLTCRLESLVGNSMRMRYPDQVRYPDIPHNVYTEDMASNAIELTSTIIQEVKSRYINKD